MPRGPDPEIEEYEILEQFLASTDPAMVPSEIADALDVTTEGARHQMNRLADEGWLEKKKPGKRTVLYWITDKGREHYFRNSSSDASE